MQYRVDIISIISPFFCYNFFTCSASFATIWESEIGIIDCICIVIGMMDGIFAC